MDISESKDFLVHTASLKEVRTFSRDVFDKLNLNNDLKDELVLAIAEAAQNVVKHAYKDIRHIIRKNRSSCCILNGKESSSDFEALSEDIFTYFGLGCRNVSKIYLPKNFEIIRLVSRLEQFSWIKKHSKY